MGEMKLLLFIPTDSSRRLPVRGKTPAAPSVGPPVMLPVLPRPVLIAPTDPTGSARSARLVRGYKTATKFSESKNPVATNRFCHIKGTCPMQRKSSETELEKL